jgi:hypothetical protein
MIVNADAPSLQTAAQTARPELEAQVGLDTAQL